MSRFGFIDIESPLWRYLGYIFDAVFLTILWVVFSIPLVTIGASTTALYTVSLRMLRGEDSGHTAKEFSEAFKGNLGQGIGAGIIMTAVGLVLGFNLYQYVNSPYKVLAIVFLVMTFVYLMIFKFIFPVIARFSNNLPNLFAMAFVLSVKNFGWTLMMITLSASIIVVGIFVFWPLLFFSVGAIALIDSWALNHIFAQYIEKNNIS